MKADSFYEKNFLPIYHLINPFDQESAERYSPGGSSTMFRRSFLSLYVAGFLLAGFVTAQELVGRCPDGFTVECALGNRCYKFARERATWENAKEKCVNAAAGASLVSIRSQAEQTCLANFQQSFNPGDNRIWIGLYVEAGIDPITNPNNWRWVDPTAPSGSGSFRNWITIGSKSEPNGDATERCAEMIFTDGYYIDASGPRATVEGGWNNMPCQKYLHYLCEAPRLPLTPNSSPTGSQNGEAPPVHLMQMQKKATSEGISLRLAYSSLLLSFLTIFACLVSS